MMTTLTEAEIKGMKVAELRVACEERSLPVEGLKAALVERLINSIGGTASAGDAKEADAEMAEAGGAKEGSEDKQVESAAAPSEENGTAEPAAPAAEESTNGVAAAATEEAEPAAVPASSVPVEEAGEPEADGPAAKRAKTSGDAIEAAPTPVPAEPSTAPAAAEPSAAPAAAEVPAAVDAASAMAPAPAPAAVAWIEAAPSALGTPLFRMGSDPRGREVFIEGLDAETTEPEIRSLCSEVGQVSHVRMVLDAAGAFRGLALVTFTERSSARAAKAALAGKKVRDGAPVSVRESGAQNTVFLARVKPTFSEEALQKEVSALAEGLLRIDMTADPNDPTRRTNRGFAFAVFENQSSAKAFMDQYGGETKLSIAGATLGVRWSTQQGHAPGEGGSEEEERRGVYVANVGADVSEEEIRAVFQPYGTVTKAVMGSSMTHATRPDFAILNFTSNKEAEDAIAGMNGKDLKGKIITCSLAKTTDKAKRRREMMQGGGGGGMGGRGGYGVYGGAGYGGGYGGGRGGYGGGGYGGGVMGGRGGYGGYGGGYGAPVAGRGGYGYPAAGRGAYGQYPQQPAAATAPYPGQYQQQAYGYPQQAYPQQAYAQQAAYPQVAAPAAGAAAQQPAAAYGQAGATQYPGYYDAQGQYHWNTTAH